MIGQKKELPETKLGKIKAKLIPNHFIVEVETPSRSILIVHHVIIMLYINILFKPKEGKGIIIIQKIWQGVGNNNYVIGQCMGYSYNS